MAFNYTYKPNPKISDIFKGLAPKPMPQSTPMTLIPGATPFMDVTRNLPAGGGTYQSPVVAQPQTPVVPKAPAIVTPQAGVQSPTQPTGLDYSKYTDPATGRVLNPQEYADMLARRVTSGSIPSYAGDTITGGGMETPEQIATRGRVLNNERNDIATGATDPYKVGSQSGIAYSPAELSAIEKAYAGIYDPALKEVFNKLDKKEKEDAAVSASKQKLSEMALSHKYDLEKIDKQFSNEKSLKQIEQDFKAKDTTSQISPYQTERSARTLQSADELLLKAKENPSIFGRSAAAPIPDFLRSDDYRNFESELNTLKAAIAFGELTAMREASKTGGALGNVSNIELSLLESALGALKMSQSPENFQNQLVKIKESINRWNKAAGSVSTGGTVGAQQYAPDGTLVEFTD